MTPRHAIFFCGTLALLGESQSPGVKRWKNGISAWGHAGQDSGETQEKSDAAPSGAQVDDHDRRIARR
ncbi:hypothetical protein PATSB16_09560 [Pandoraea thiooxydans]|nr:hypothetical protein PATSB16_09560 [Pandoraea thiooxydans]